MKAKKNYHSKIKQKIKPALNAPTDVTLTYTDQNNLLVRYSLLSHKYPQMDGLCWLLTQE